MESRLGCTKGVGGKSRREVLKDEGREGQWPGQGNAEKMSRIPS